MSGGEIGNDGGRKREWQGEKLGMAGVESGECRGRNRGDGAIWVLSAIFRSVAKAWKRVFAILYVYIRQSWMCLLILPYSPSRKLALATAQSAV